MEEKIKSKGTVAFAIAAPAALAAGALNGLLGTGGGILFTLIYRKLMPSPKDAFVSAMTTVLPISAVSLMTYGGDAVLSAGELVPLAISSGLGGLLGAYLSTRVSSRTLELIFSLIVIYSGLRMLFT